MNHASIYNRLVTSINEYNTEIKNIMDSIGSNINTDSYSIFTHDADTYLNNLLIQKSGENDANKNKTITLNNTIEVIKKRITYIFNVILLIAFITIIIILGLILYLNIPFYFKYIIALCSILIFIVIVYFIYIIVQPTRMIANKNYWAIVNPSQKLMSKI